MPKQPEFEFLQAATVPTEGVENESGDEPPKRSIDALVGALSSATGRVFDRIEIAEQEIARACEAISEPETVRRLQESFVHLQPSPVLEGLSDDVFRAHVLELLQRVETKKDLRPGTQAEVLGALSRASQAAPLNRTAFALYCRLFRDVLPDAVNAHHHALDEYEDYYRDESDALRRDARRLLSVPDRRLG